MGGAWASLALHAEKPGSFLLLGTTPAGGRELHASHPSPQKVKGSGLGVQSQSCLRAA